MSETSEVFEKDMDKKGNFPCPKCGKIISPTDPDKVTMIINTGFPIVAWTVVLHECGQKVKIHIGVKSDAT